MRIMLPEHLQAQLVREPETGMGYHRVDLYFEDGNKLTDVVVLNGSVISLADPIRIRVVKNHEDKSPT